MGRHGVRLLVLALIALGALLLVQQCRLGEEKRAAEKAELDAGLAASRVVAETFAREASLRVATLSGRVMSQGSCTSAYLFADQQRTVAPFSVAYSVDLKEVGRGSYRWNAADRVMFVTLPDVTVEPPNTDMAHARSVQSGLYVSRACGLALQQQIAGRLAAASAERARRPDHMNEARAAARAAVAALLRAPLAAAGVGPVEVRVRFPFDGEAGSDKQWDVSRPINEVLADPRSR